MASPAEAISQEQNTTESPEARHNRLWAEIEKNRPLLFGLAYYLTKNRHDAEDLLQETLLKVHRKLHLYKDDMFMAWVKRIMQNIFISKFKKNKQYNEVVESSSHDFPGPHDVQIPEEQVIISDRISHEVRRALEDLPDTFRQAVILFSRGMMYKEIAEVQEVALGTVMSRISRARKQLRKVLEQYAYQEGILKKIPETKLEEK